MGRKKHAKVANLAQEAEHTELEAKPFDERMTIRDAVEAWLSENSEPKHLAVGGTSYEGFISNCYQYLLSRALQQGVTSANALIGQEDCNQIVAFLDRAKAQWDERRKEQALVEERCHAAELRLVELRRLAEELRRKDEHRRAEERGFAEGPREGMAGRQVDDAGHDDPRFKQSSQRQAKDDGNHDELFRKEQIFARHHKMVEDERARLRKGQCSASDYYAYVLRDRIERSAELLFGSAQQPNYELLQKNPELLKRLKDNLSFGDNKHPSMYEDPYVSAYYTLRYELGYAFEYSQLYRMLIDFVRRENEESPLDVLSIGCGQGLDYWGLRFALSKQGTDWPSFGWHGVDLESWPDHILDDGIAHYSDNTDVRDLLSGMDRLDAKVLMFPKVISELPYEVVSFIASWLERVTLTRDVHYLCFAHTEAMSLDPSSKWHRGSNESFDGTVETTLDPVKSAALIGAACNGARRQSYRCERNWRDTDELTVAHYDVVWPDLHTGGTWTDQYQYFIYKRVGGNDPNVGDYDPTFAMDTQLRNYIKNIGSSCCKEFIAAQDGYYGGESSSCEVRRVSCDNSFFCPLFKYPRLKTGSMAYQVVRLVKEPSYDEDIPF